MERNEAIDVVKINYPHVTESGSQFETALRTLIPELKESKDERVIERIKKAVESYWSDEPLDEILAWLEKQGEQNIANSAKTCKDAQNHAWSEEDEDYYDAIIAKLEVTQEDALLTDNQMNFLKSLKDKYVPQLKIEWSEEDKNMLQSILDECKSMPTEKRNWLKSLKNRFLPQPKQEWSDWDKTIIESIEALCDEKLESVVYQDVKEHVNYIKEWLKSLRPQKQRKPTKEQMDALLFVVQHYTPKVTDKLAWDSIKILELMYYEIKTLKL